MLRRDVLRNALVLGAAAVVLPKIALAAGASVPPAHSPFAEVGPFAADGKKVWAFFDFECSNCRDLHVTLANWGASLPKGKMVMEFSPIVTMEPRKVAAVRGFEAAKRIATPQQLNRLMEGIYNLVQTHGRSLDNAETWRSALKYAGIPESAFVEQWGRVSSADVDRYARRMVEYNVRATPALGIGGRFVITPDNASGNMRLFIDLANGLTSKAITS